MPGQELDLAGWLGELGLERYAHAFVDAEVTPEILPELTDADLRELGLPLGPRKAVLKAIHGMAGPRAAPGTTADAAPAEGGPDTAAGPSEAERRQLTVMFADLADSTALSRRLDPEEMREVLRAYQDAVAGEVARFEGHVAKFMGDGVLAYFGWPSAHEDEAERSVRAGLAVVEAVGRLTTPAGGPLAARVGIGTGLVVVGGLAGEGSAREQTVAGETPNLAARLQAVAQPGAVVIAAVDAAADRRRVRGRGSRAAGAQGLCRRRAGMARAWRARGRQPFRGARDRADTAGGTRTRGRAPARPLAAGPRRRGTGGAALGRAGDRQVPHRPSPRRASHRRDALPALPPVLALLRRHRAPPDGRATGAGRWLPAGRHAGRQAGQARGPARPGDGSGGRDRPADRGAAVHRDGGTLPAAQRLPTKADGEND